MRSIVHDPPARIPAISRHPPAILPAMPKSVPFLPVYVPPNSPFPRHFCTVSRHFCTVCGTVFYPPFCGFPEVFPLLPPFFHCGRSLGLVLDGTQGGAAGG